MKSKRSLRGADRRGVYVAVDCDAPRKLWNCGTAEFFGYVFDLEPESAVHAERD
jgi:hypothetical protein